eukprot:3007927-Pleurochrysis_carterae.AAC.1
MSASWPSRSAKPSWPDTRSILKMHDPPTTARTGRSLTMALSTSRTINLTMANVASLRRSAR